MRACLYAWVCEALGNREQLIRENYRGNWPHKTLAEDDTHSHTHFKTKTSCKLKLRWMQMLLFFVSLFLCTALFFCVVADVTQRTVTLVTPFEEPVIVSIPPPTHLSLPRLRTSFLTLINLSVCVHVSFHFVSPKRKESVQEADTNPVSVHYFNWPQSNNLNYLF